MSQAHQIKTASTPLNAIEIYIHSTYVLLRSRSLILSRTFFIALLHLSSNSGCNKSHPFALLRCCGWRSLFGADLEHPKPDRRGLPGRNPDRQFELWLGCPCLGNVPPSLIWLRSYSWYLRIHTRILTHGSGSVRLLCSEKKWLKVCRRGVVIE